MIIQKDRVATLSFIWEKFINACDAMAEDWDDEEYGEAEGYFGNIALTAALVLVSADGIYQQEEVDLLNDIFDSCYTSASLKDAYNNAPDSIDTLFHDEIASAIELLQNCNEKLAEFFVDFLTDLCDAIIESDYFISRNERAMAEELHQNLNHM